MCDVSVFEQARQFVATYAVCVLALIAVADGLGMLGRKRGDED